MIQKANVGVGISGAEGLQAACASDYSIAQVKRAKRFDEFIAINETFPMNFSSDFCYDYFWFMALGITVECVN